MEIGGGPTSEHSDTWVASVPLDDRSLIDRFPYASRLGSNDILSDDEIEGIEAFLHEPIEQIQQMEAEMSSLQARLDFLRLKHASLKNQVQTCQSLITISRRLPEDILLEIFFRCLPETSNPNMDSTTAPLLLTAVCRRWRFLALQTPRLWSAIHIPIEHKYFQDPDRISLMLDALHEWLRRARTCPLTISMDVSNSVKRTNRTIQVMDAFWKILRPSIPRWRNVFFAGNINYLSALETIPSSDFQSLESLLLDLHSAANSVPPVAPNIFEGTRLRKLSIKYQAFDPASLAIPWDQMTHLHLGEAMDETGQNVGSLSTVLNLCSSLVYLGLAIAYGDDIKPIYLPNLQKISIRQLTSSKDSDTCTVFVKNLRAPSLLHISLRDFDDTFGTVLSHHGRFIQTLDFNDNYLQFEALADGLRHCSSVLSLALTRFDGDSDHDIVKVDKRFFSRFIGNDESSNGPLCPLLQELLLEDIPCDSLTTLVSFLETKQTADPRVLSPLKMLSVDVLQEEGTGSDYLPDETVIHALTPFTNAGLLFKMWRDDRPCSCWMSGYRCCRSDGYEFQYADCWRD